MVQNRRSSHRKKQTILGFLGLLVFLLAIIGALSALRGETRVSNLFARYIRHDGFEVPVYRDVEVADFRRDAFSRDANGFLHYDDGKTVGVTGIDVSAHQGKIDWKAVAEAGVKFAFVRIGYRGYQDGKLYRDERFEENYEGAKDAGLAVGVYFYSQAVTEAEAREEAALTLRLLENRKPDLPLVLDWEYGEGNAPRTKSVGKSTLTSIANAFCEKIRSAGFSTAIYFNRSLGYHIYDLSELTGSAFWVADYDTYPMFYYRHTFWQYSDTATVDGISEKVDLDMWFYRK